VLTALFLNLLYQFWIHADWIPKLGWLEYVLNTPSAHRVHHARNPEYLDANFGGVLIVFDRLFGTYVAEREEVPCDFGLVSPVTSPRAIRSS
jgi:sterol desaturase/sphingolipid hydroxylase (fatty acid hydroxylase superfamily)